LETIGLTGTLGRYLLFLATFALLFRKGLLADYLIFFQIRGLTALGRSLGRLGSVHST
jgi:hypothetical protein